MDSSLQHFRYEAQFDLRNFGPTYSFLFLLGVRSMLILVEDFRSLRPFALQVLILDLLYYLNQTGVLMAYQDRTITGSHLTY